MKAYLLAGDSTPVSVTLPRLRVRGHCFEQENGTRFTAIQCSDFNLLNRFQHGEDITQILSQRRDIGFNMLRVWTLYDQPGLIGTYLDFDPSTVVPFCNLCASYGLYVEFTAITYPSVPVSHWQALTNACRQVTNALVELVNENDVHPIDLTPYARPDGILCSHGSNGSAMWPVAPYWDYGTFHTNGASEEQRKVGHNAMEIWAGPTQTNETSRFPDVGMWTGADIERQKNLAFDSAAGAALLCAGSCFHSVRGKDSTLFDDAHVTVATAWVTGAKSVDLSQQDFDYVHRGDLENPTILRVYQRGSAIVPIRA